MNNHDVVYGLLDTSADIGHETLAAKCRALTVSWSRYDYHGPIIEGPTIDAIVTRASDAGYRYCFIQAYGQIIRERWAPNDHTRSFLSALRNWISTHDVLVAGRILTTFDGWYGLDPRCLLIDLHRHADCGKPEFGVPRDAVTDLPSVMETRDHGQIRRLDYGHSSTIGTPRLPGWQIARTSLEHHLPVLALPKPLEEHVLDLAPDRPDAAAALRRVLETGVESFPGPGAFPGLTSDQTTFLRSVSRQVANARRGVFLLNIEEYADVETPPPAFRPPVSSLYAVAAGFKPLRILQTHGMTERTQVVYFDYSDVALAVRRTIVEEWDGENFPRFIQRLLERFPPDVAFYQLWDGATPDVMEWATVRHLWTSETIRFGGERMLRDHWHEYRRLPHRYIHCDILDDPTPLLATMQADPGDVIWFSNAAFTMYSNWRYSLEERKERYDRWVAQLAATSPHLLLYGSDYNNSNVNRIAAGEYWMRYQELDGGPLDPCPPHGRQVRM